MDPIDDDEERLLVRLRGGGVAVGLRTQSLTRREQWVAEALVRNGLAERYSGSSRSDYYRLVLKVR
jgi:hypothetical protein